MVAACCLIVGFTCAEAVLFITINSQGVRSGRELRKTQLINYSSVHYFRRLHRPILRAQLSIFSVNQLDRQGKTSSVKRDNLSQIKPFYKAGILIRQAVCLLLVKLTISKCSAGSWVIPEAHRDL